MTISDVLMILAVLSGPVIAVQLTRYLDAKREKRDRKLQIFKTLMATRAYTISMDHVMTLNRIDLEFETSNPKEKEVINAWKQYLDLLSDKSISGEQWAVRRIDLLVELLHKMALVLDYDFDKTHIRNSSYSPVAHSDIESQQAKVREGVVDLLEGKRSLQMHITNWPES